MATSNSVDSNKSTPQGVYKNPRFMHVSTSIVGCTVHLQTKDGDIWEGIFATFSSDFAICLDLAVKIDPKFSGHDCLYQTLKNGAKAQEKAFFDLKDIVRITVVDVDLNAIKEMDKLATDVDISGFNSSKTLGKHRELESWQDDDGDNANDDSLMSLDEVGAASKNGSQNNSRAGWDAQEMFKFNERVHKVNSTYDGDLRDYTIALPKPGKQDKDWRKKQERAAAIAREIEINPQSQSRLAKEDGSDDEEEKFSAVVRPGAEQKSPQQLKQQPLNQQHQQQQQPQQPQQQQPQQQQQQRSQTRQQPRLQPQQQTHPTPSPQSHQQQQQSPQPQQPQQQAQPQTLSQSQALPQSQAPQQQPQTRSQPLAQPQQQQPQPQIQAQQQPQNQSQPSAHSQQQQPSPSAPQQQQQQSPHQQQLQHQSQPRPQRRVNNLRPPFANPRVESNLNSFKNFSKQFHISQQPKDQSEIAKNSKLNPNAKEFVYKPRSPATSVQGAPTNGATNSAAPMDPANSSPLSQPAHGAYYQQVPIFSHGLPPHQQQHFPAQFMPNHPHMHFQSQIHYMPAPMAPHFAPQQMSPRYIRGNFQNYHHQNGEHMNNVRAAYSQSPMVAPTSAAGQPYVPSPSGGPAPHPMNAYAAGSPQQPMMYGGPQPQSVYPMVPAAGFPPQHMTHVPNPPPYDGSQYITPTQNYVVNQ